MFAQSRCWKSFLGAVIGVAILASAAQAQVLSYVRSFEPQSGVCYPRALEVSPDGGFVVTSDDCVVRFNSTWSLTGSVANHTPGLTGEPFRHPYGGASLPDGRLLVPDVDQNRFVVFTSGGSVSEYWAAGFGPGVPTHLHASPTGDCFMAFTQSGVTTVRRWNSSGALVRTWSVGETLPRLAVRNGVVYLTGDASGRLYRYDFDGHDLGMWYLNAGPNVSAIGVDDAGRIYLAITSPMVRALVAYGADGSTLQTIVANAAWHPLSAPSDILVTGSSVYVADGSAGYGTVHEFALTAPVPALTKTWGGLKAMYR